MAANEACSEINCIPVPPADGQEQTEQIIDKGLARLYSAA